MMPFGYDDHAITDYLKSAGFPSCPVRPILDPDEGQIMRGVFSGMYSHVCGREEEEKV